MRHVRMALGLAAAVCAFGVIAAPALAKPKKEVVFGKFTASYPNGKMISAGEPASTKGHGEVFNINLANGALRVEKCNKELKSGGTVTSEESDTFFENVRFSKCLAKVQINPGLTEELVIPNFSLAMQFRSNKSVEVGEGSEMEIVKPSTVTIPIGKRSPCKVTIPSQTVPSKAVGKPGQEYEAAFYETEIEEFVNKKKFPAGFQEKLDIEMEFTKSVESWVKPGERCIYAGGEEGAFDSNPESPSFGYVVYKKGTFDAELEEITIKNGNLGFRPAPEA